MLRYVALLAAAVVIALAPASALANEDVGKNWTLTIGGFVTSDSNLCGDSTKNGVSLALLNTLQRTEKGSVNALLRYTRYELKNGASVTLWSPLLEYRWNVSPQAFVAVAGGFLNGSNSDGDHTWSAAGEVGVGTRLSSSFLIEGRWFSGTKRGERGFIVSLGASF